MKNDRREVIEMRSKLFVSVAAFVVLAGLVFGSIAFAKPATTPKPKKFGYIGLVTAVDYNNTKVTVNVKTGKKSLRKALEMDASTAIVKQNGKRGKFTELVVGAKVQVKGTIVNGILKASWIRVIGGKRKGSLANLKATVTATDLTASTVSVKVGDGTVFIFKVNSSTKITRDKFNSALRELVPNDKVKVVKADIVNGVATAKRIDAEPQFEGTIATVDAANKTLTFTLEGATAAKTVSLEGSTININGVAAMNGVPDGTSGHIEVNGTVGTNGVITATVVNIYDFEVEGTITAIDQATKVVTITKADGSTMNVLVNDLTGLAKGSKVKMRGTVSALGATAYTVKVG